MFWLAKKTSSWEELKKHKANDHERIQIVHAPEVVEMHESPSQALRTKKESSMRIAIELVRDGQAAACVSAGNTGALMATSRFVLKMLPGHGSTCHLYHLAWKERAHSRT